ncbi:winged helix-turn-helix transcriptional regulator [Methanocella conradii]|uniref:winged helix-turn-helix transcriptional regulator n=1 Tax=Methanocella conradii TaxID=1175444 RepID=UPI0024B35036|nr:winged helix-turn-helix transcriptional regulator [Methanocella conradii]MDI6897297.1 winged helix-turn-helix transcriptional regulator [Methanocella conradii]
MIALFEKYVDMKILGLFLSNPNTSYHVKGIARKLGVSPASVSHAMKYFEDMGYVIKEEKGLAHIYQLNKEHPVVASLKKAYGIALVQSANPVEAFLSADPNIVSFALYGGYADGSFDEQSDIEFIAVAPSAIDKFSNTRKFSEVRKALEEKLGRPVSIFVATMSIWSAMKGANDPMYKRIMDNHVLIYGNGLEDPFVI